MKFFSCPFLLTKPRNEKNLSQNIESEGVVRKNPTNRGCFPATLDRLLLIVLQ